MNCIICDNESKFLFAKQNSKYYQCSNCETVFVPNGLNQENKIGGSKEVERNNTHNFERLNRFVELNANKMLDFGCGNGMLVDYLNDNNIIADGYDLYNPIYNSFKNNNYDLVSMVEVIEHTCYPFNEIDVIYGKLKDGGILYIETSFVDIAKSIGIKLNDYEYINPLLGHCTIFSFLGLDLLIESKGFEKMTPINDNVRLYVKMKKPLNY